MKTHEQLELLSAYLDGELTPDERARLEPHLATCAECKRTLEGLRAAVAEMRALEQPEPSPQDSWALRGAIARARKRPGRLTRAILGTSGVAAVVVAALAIMLQNGGDPDNAALRLESAGVPVVPSTIDYTESRTEDRLVEVLGRVNPQEARTGPGGATVSTPQAATAGGTAAEDAAAKVPDFSQEVTACEQRTIAPATDEGLSAVQYEAAYFKQTPAYLLFYLAPASEPDRIELWVLARSDCRVLYFTQRKL